VCILDCSVTVRGRYSQKIDFLDPKVITKVTIYMLKV